MTNCQGCTEALTEPKTAIYLAGCNVCMARVLAGTGAHLESASNGKMTPRYRHALIVCFGEEGVDDGHKLVKGWAQTLRKTKERDERYRTSKRAEI